MMTTPLNNHAPETATPHPLSQLPLKEQLFQLILDPQQGVERFNQWRQNSGFHVLDLSDLDFTGCNLSGINFSNCNLLNCQFEETLLHEATLVFAVLTGSFCYNTQFFQANLIEADFKNCHLEGAIFTGADATEAEFTGSTFTNIQAQDANFTAATFTNATVRDVDFTGAILKQVDFTAATCAEYLQLETALYDETTHFPQGTLL